MIGAMGAKLSKHVHAISSVASLLCCFDYEVRSAKSRVWVCRVHSTGVILGPVCEQSRFGVRSELNRCALACDQAISCATSSRKVNVRLPGKGNSTSHGTRPVYWNYLDDTVDSGQ